MRIIENIKKKLFTEFEILEQRQVEDCNITRFKVFGTARPRIFVDGIINIDVKVKIENGKKLIFEKKFKKERRLCRFAGIILVLVNFSCTALFIATSMKTPSELFKKYNWLIFIYVAYALYKLINAFVLLQKSRRSWSPYREIFCNISFFECLITVISVESLIFGVFNYFDDKTEITLASISVFVITIITLVLGVKMIKSRPVPNLIQ